VAQYEEARIMDVFWIDEQSGLHLQTLQVSSPTNRL
jgi:hypothetical protein